MHEDSKTQYHPVLCIPQLYWQQPTLDIITFIIKHNLIISKKIDLTKFLFEPLSDQNFYSRFPQDVGRDLATEVPLKESEKLWLPKPKYQHITVSNILKT